MKLEIRTVIAVAGLLILTGCAIKNETSATKPLSSPAVTTQQEPPTVSGMPRYPREAAIKRISGTVCFLFDVQTDGTPTNLRITRSEPSGVFDEIALHTIAKWKFKPAIIADKPAVKKDATYCLDYKIAD